MIKAVLFDLDDTLLWDNKSVKEAFRATCKEAREKYGVNEEHLEEAVRHEARQLYARYDTYEFTQMIGINPFEGLWGDFDDKINKNFRQMKEIVPHYRREAWKKGLQKVGIDDHDFALYLAERFPFHRRRLPFLYEDSLSTLETLKKKYSLLLLTNGSPTLQNEKLDMTPELVPYFSYISVSGAFGRGKPDPSIFEHALFLLGIKKEEAVMVGDNLHTDILGSNRIGMKNVWLNRTGRKNDTDITYTAEIATLKELPSLLQQLN